MMGEFWEFIQKILLSAWNMIEGASVWMMVSYTVAGVLHEYLTTERLQKSRVGTTHLSGIFWATITGMFIPICSCGSIPLGIGLYYSGAYLGPTLAFMTANPMINPIAVILSLGLLGKEITIIYVITGFVAPMIIGLIANRFAGDEMYLKRTEPEKQPIKLSFDEKPSHIERILNGLRWSYTELAVTVSKYTVTGMLTAALIFGIVPQSAIQRYLGDPSMISMFGITVIAAFMYVCAVGHIPFIAALVASGAAPGVAITFLMAGAGTNLGELITIRKTIGKRAMIMYFFLMVIISNAVGYFANRILPNFKPVLDFDAATNGISYANHMLISVPEWVHVACTLVLIGYAAYAFYRELRKKAAARRAD